MPIKILLVDDNRTFVAAVRHFLDMLPGVIVIGEAHDGHAALAQAGEMQPDLIVMDIAMPHLNGLEAARCMQAWPHPPRIVFLSLHDSDAYRAAALELGAVGFVSKADFVAELLPVIERMATHTPCQEPSC